MHFRVHFLSASGLFVSASSSEPVSPAISERYAAVVTELFGRLNFERLPEAARTIQDFRLQRMADLLQALGNPQLRVPTVHLAGSKGKGSTATMVAAIAAAAGLKVGLFTSPHVHRFEERFTINQELPSPTQIVNVWDTLLPALQQIDQSCPPGPTFFEIMTALGWLHFLKESVQLAVMEVGLGGRLDSTNLCAPLVTAITSISRDHMRLLGDTVEEIAREKAGIAKAGVPLIVGDLLPGPLRVISEVAASAAAPLFKSGQDFRVQDVTAPNLAPDLPRCHQFDYHDESVHWQRLDLAMPGAHQVRNAGVAIAMIRHLEQAGFSFTEETVRRGLLAARCPLRVDVRGTQPLLIVDVAHNPASIAALCETLSQVRATRRLAVFSASRDKEVRTLLQLLRDHFDEFILTRFVENPRAVELPELAEMAQQLELPEWSLAATPAEALTRARERATADDLICVTGSFFLAAEVSELLESVEGRETRV